MEHFIEISFIFLVSLVFLYYYYHDKNGLPSNWPIVGMLPGLFLNIRNLHDYVAELVERTQLTFVFEGPWLANMHLLVTADPANVHHVMSKNFGNYPKGSKFKEIFDVIGDGISNSDFQMWEYQRKMAKSFLNHSKFHENLVKKIEEKIESGLKPMLDHICNQGIEIDLQDLFGRLSFDTSCTVLMDMDPKSLSIEMPSVPSSKALTDLEEIILYRHVIPPSIWKFQRWLNIGREKKHKQAWKILDDFIYNCIAIKRSQNMSNQNSNNCDLDIDLLTLYTEENETNNQTPYIRTDDNKFLRDTILNLLIAARDSMSVTLSWFFYLLSKNTRVQTKLRQELEEIMSQTQDFSKNSRELCSKLVYLHATLCETLRLYPPVPFEVKSPIEADILPSGHKLKPNMLIIFSLYGMGRMKSIWGDDCLDFKPERWISEEGKIRHEPSYKFIAFNAGPRTCIGKDMAFIQMKIVAAAILRNYHIEPVEGFEVVPDISIILHMKYGLKVKVSHLQ